MRILGHAPIGGGDNRVGSFQDHHRPPLRSGSGRKAAAIGLDVPCGLAHQARHLAGMRGQDTVLAQAPEQPRRVGQRVESVGIHDQRTGNVRHEVVHKPPGGAVAAQAGPDQSGIGALQLAHDLVVRGVADGPWCNLDHRRRHHLGALGRQDRVDALGDEQTHEPGSRAGGRGRAQVGGSRQAQAARHHDHGAEGALVGVKRPVGKPQMLGRSQTAAGAVQGEDGGGDGQARVVGDAHLHLGAARLAQEADLGSALRPGQNLDLAPGEAESGAVEALDYRLLGRPAPGQAVGAVAAVVDLGLGVGLAQEAAARAPEGQGEAVHADGVDAYSLHPPNRRGEGRRGPRFDQVAPFRYSRGV